MIPLKDENPTQRFAVVTALLVVVNVAVFLFVQERDSVSRSAEFTLEYAAVPCEVVEGRALTQDEVFLTYQQGVEDACNEGRANSPQFFPDKRVWLAVVFSMFLHGGWLHLGGNMLFLWIFGNNIEDHLGPVKYALFYLLAGLVGFAAHVLPQTDSTVPVIGASGAVAGVMGAYLVWYPNAPVRTLFFFFLVWIRDVPAKLLLGVWFVLQFFTDSGSGVAWLAHVGGFVFGMAIGGFVRASARVRRAAFAGPYRDIGRWDDTGGVGRRGFSSPPGERRFGGRRWE